MEVGFLVIMVGLFIIMATVVSLFKSKPDHTCGNCRHFGKTPGSKHMGKCFNVHSYKNFVFDYEESCESYHKNKEEEDQSWT